MRYINKFTCSVLIIIGSFCSFLFPQEYQSIFFTSFLAISCLIIGLLIYKYHCVNLIAGIASSKKQNPILENYIGKLMFIVSASLACATVFSIIDHSLLQSWYMLIFAMPIILYAGYCFIKLNKVS